MGSGKAAAKQKTAFEQLPRRYEVVEHGNADITSICTPHFRHFDDVMVALEHGHVFVEKPMCGSIEQSALIDDKATGLSRQVFQMFQYRYADHSPFEDNLVIEMRRDPPYWQRGWRSRWDEALGGAVVMHATHGLDLIVERYGMPAALQARLWGPSDIKVETRGIVAMQWTNGFMCTLGVAADGDVGREEDPCGWTLGNSDLGYVRLFERIWYNLNPVAGGEPIPYAPGIQDGRNSVELLTAIYKSFLYDRWVQLPILEADQFYLGWTQLMKAWYGQPPPQSLTCH